MDWNNLGLHLSLLFLHNQKKKKKKEKEKVKPSFSEDNILALNGLSKLLEFSA